MIARTPTRPELLYGALIAVQVFFGLQYLAAKVLLEEIEPPVWALIRVTAAAVLLVAAARIGGRSLPRDPGILWRLALYSVFGVSLNQYLFVEGLERTTPGHASIIMTGIPVTALMFAVLLRRERWRLSKAIAVAVSLAGVLLIIWRGAAEQPGASWTGDVMIFVNSTSYSFFLVISKDLLNRIDSLSATALLFVFGGIGLALVAGPSLAGFDPTTVSTTSWALGLFIVLVPTVGAYLLTVWTLARVESSLVALFIYLQPVVATSLSYLLFDERPTATTIVGAGLVFVGVFLAVRRRAS